MRVGLVVVGDLDTRTGGYYYDRRLVAGLRAAGDAVDTLELPWASYPRRLARGVDARTRRRLAAFARGRDVLLQDELAHPTLLAANGALDGTPLVGLVHHLRADEGRPATPLYRALERRYCRGLDAVVANSEQTLDSVRALAPDLPGVVAPPAADRFDPDPPDVGTRAREGPLRVVTVGTVVPRKGHRTLVDGLAAVDAPWELTVVGDETAAPGYVADLREHVARRGVADRVRFAGALSDADLAETLAGSHVSAMPSRHEGFGIASLEGMAFGLPAVASAAGGARSLVTHGEDGFLVPPGGAGAVASALGTLATDRERLARMGRAARARFEAHPDWPTVAERARAFLVAVDEGRAGEGDPDGPFAATPGVDGS
jgi:glycosyltransferase involved in cell wall biosynthesis